MTNNDMQTNVSGLLRDFARVRRAALAGERVVVTTRDGNLVLTAEPRTAASGPDSLKDRTSNPDDDLLAVAESAPAVTLGAGGRSGARVAARRRPPFRIPCRDPLPFDAPAARAYGRICSALMAKGRVGRRRFADLLIAATALAHDLPLYTRNPGDLKGLERLLVVRTV